MHTPNLNRLAAEGARFNAYTTAPQCSPSRASLTTGRYPTPTARWASRTATFAGTYTRTSARSRRFCAPPATAAATGALNTPPRDPRRIGNDVYVETRDIEAIVSGVSRSSTRTAHDHSLCRLASARPHRVGGHGFGGQPYDAKGITIPPYLVDAPDTRADLADFQGCVNRADAYIGRLLTILEDRGLLDETLVLYVGDHGIAFPRAKCTLYDPGIEISLIARLPGSPLSGGVAPGGMVSNLDVVPTLIELTGAEAPPDLHGASLLPLAAGTSSGHSELFVEKTYHSYYDPMRGIRTHRWKYIRNFETGLGVEIPSDIAGSGAYRDLAGRLDPSHHVDVELYDLHADPNETTNLAGQPETAAIESELGAKVTAWMHGTGDPLLDGPVASPFYRDTMLEITS